MAFSIKPIRQRSRRARILSFLNLFALMLLYLLEMFVAEKTWLTTLLTYLPQMLFVLPTLALLTLSLCVRRWRFTLPIHLMGLLFCILVLMPFTVAGLCPVRQNIAEARLLRVATFNTENGHQGVVRVQSALEDLKADILFLEEAQPFASDPVMRQSLYDAYPYWAVEGSIAIASRYPLRDIQRHALPPGPSCLSATVQIDGVTVTIVCVHLLAYRYEPFGRATDTPQIAVQSLGDWRYSTVRREPQIAALCRVLNQLSDPLILGGDFNMPPRGLYFRRLLGNTGMRDVWREAGVCFGATLPARFPGVQVDHLFRRGDSLITQRAYVPVMPDASDHRPLVAEFLVRSRRF